MSCADLAPRLSAWVDGETDVEISEHVKGCAVCTAEATTLRRLKDGIHRLDRSAAPPHLRETITRALRPRFRFPAWVPASAAAAVLVASLLFLSPSTTEAIPDLVARSSDFYDRLLEGRVQPADCSTPEQIRAYFKERLGLSVDVPDLPEAEVSGGCPCDVTTVASPWIVYRCGRDILSLLVFEGTPPILPDAARRRGIATDYYVFRCGRNTVFVCCSGPATHLWIARMDEAPMRNLILSTPEGKQALEGIRISVEEVTCAVCCSSVESQMCRMKGVRSATFDAQRREFVVDIDETATSPDDIVQALRAAGFNSCEEAKEKP